MNALFSSVDITAPGFKADPHPVFAQWREDAPIVRVGMRGPAAGADEAFLVTRYADVSALLKDRRLVKQPDNAGLKDPWVPRLVRPLMRNMLALDDPDHARLKRLVQSAFNPRRIEMMQLRTEEISSALIDKLQAGKPFDLVHDYALPLPVAVISDMLGVPPRDRLRFASWSGALIRGAASTWNMVKSIPQIFAFLRYLKELIASKRSRPGDDLVLDLVQREIEGDSLDHDELLAMVAILLSAGHETTTNLIGNGVVALLDDADAAEEWRRDSGAPETAIDEMLRFAGPVMTSTHRYAREDVDIAGVRIGRGSLVLGVIASANRDELQFAQADRLVLGRSPNRHLTFGEGGHYCVGARLARMEGQIAFRHLMTKLPMLRLADNRSEVRYQKGLVLSGPAQCRLIFG